jgi:exopolysaccharide biosynthesis polyprenyl glycosylphosphotransferase
MTSFLPRAPRLRPIFAFLDAAMLAAAIWLAHVVRFAPDVRQAKWRQLVDHPGLLVAALIALWALSVAAELYEPLTLRRRREVMVRILVVAVALATALVVGTYLVPSWRFGRGLLLLTTLTWAVMAGALRSVATIWIRRRPRPRALVVGEPAAVAETCRRLVGHPLLPWEPVDGSLLTPDAVALEARKQGVELVVLVGTEVAVGGQAEDLAALLFSGVPVVVASEVWAWLEGRLPVAELSPSAFLQQPGFGLVHRELFNRITRVADVVLGAILLVLGAPVVGLAGLAVLVFDGRPVFYLQTRVGQFGRHFRVVKLRTMRVDAEEEGPSFATPYDPRVTRLGRVLRRLRLDELPQLFNVLRGEMSLVGPRPERPEFVADLAQAVPYYTFRLAVPPGLTGWAQVNMPYAVSGEDHRRKLEYDLYFIRERSFTLYLLTLLRTASAALAGTRR